jgi:hypothetical protein
MRRRSRGQEFNVQLEQSAFLWFFWPYSGPPQVGGTYLYWRGPSVLSHSPIKMLSSSRNTLIATPRANV